MCNPCFHQKEVVIEQPAGQAAVELIGLEYEQYAFSSTLTLQHKPVGILARGAICFSLNGQRLDVTGGRVLYPWRTAVFDGHFYFQEVPLSNTLRMQFGFRLDLQNSGALPNEVFPEVSLSRKAFNYSGSLGLNVRPFEGLEMGAQLARSHRNPMVEELFANGAHLGAGVYEKGNTRLNDEIGHGGDVFVTWERGPVKMELTGFVNDFANYIIFEPTGEVDEPSGYEIFQYAEGKARLYGNEFNMAYHITDRLSWQSSMDWVRGRRVFDSAPNQNLPFIPPFRWRNEIEYDYVKGWLGASYMAVRKQDQVSPEEEVTEGYGLLGFQAGYRLNKVGKHVLIFRVENALDTKYRDHLSRIEDRNFVMPGRNVNVTYRWFF